jgi:hypothetical protein
MPPLSRVDILSTFEETYQPFAGAFARARRWRTARNSVRFGASFMKRLTHAVAVLVLLFATTPLFAMKRNVVDEVIRMTQAGVSEDTILEYVHKSDAVFDVNADDVIEMTNAHVSKRVIDEVVRESDHRDGRTERRSTTVYVAPAYAPYPYYAYDPYWYDPFWYGPRVSIGFGFGFGHYGYGHYGHYYGHGGFGHRHR